VTQKWSKWQQITLSGVTLHETLPLNGKDKCKKVNEIIIAYENLLTSSEVDSSIGRMSERQKHIFSDKTKSESV